MYSGHVSPSNTVNRGLAVPVARRVDGFSYAIRNVVAGSATRRGRRRPRPLPEHRRPQRVRFQDAAAPDRRRRARDARRAQRLRPVAGHRAGARSRRGGTHRHGVPGVGRPRADHRGHVRSHRSGAERARRQRRAKCSCRCRRTRCTRRCSRRSTRARSTTGPIRRAAGCRISITSRAWSPRDARARRHRSEQPDRRDLPRRHAPRAARFRRPARPGRFSPTRCTAISATTARSTRSASSIRMRAIITFSSLSKAYLAPGLANRLDGASGARRGSTMRWPR